MNERLRLISVLLKIKIKIKMYQKSFRCNLW